MELSYILTPIFSFVLLKMMLENRSKAREDNVRLLEEALKNPALDRATIESLAYQLTGARSPRSAGPSRMMAMLLAVGWIALFSGLGVWLIGELISQQGAVAGGLLTSIVGFGLVTYPFALRELEARQKA
jgi:hypothetical protein